MIAGSDWTLEDWELFFQEEEERKKDGKKCRCVGAYYQHVKPEDRINILFNWQCMICRKQFRGT